MSKRAKREPIFRKDVALNLITQHSIVSAEQVLLMDVRWDFHSIIRCVSLLAGTLLLAYVAIMGIRRWVKNVPQVTWQR